MPIDFERVPPRVPVPAPPRPLVVLWATLLAVMMGTGAGLTVLLWPTGQPSNTLWFWCCAIVYPILAWAFLLCCSRGIAYARCSEAMTINHVSDKIEQECHALASEPLAVLGHAWCFSSQDTENDAEGVVNGSLQLDARPSAAEPGTDVSARWLEIPGMPFYPGNELIEHKRHRAIGNWLLTRLVERVGGGLAALPAHTVLHVDVCVHSLAESAEMQARLQEVLMAKAPTLQVRINASRNHFLLFRADDWHDQTKPREAHLLLAIQLRKAISELLQDGVAETGVALLVAQPGSLRNAPALHLHRPAKGKADGKHEAFELAVRWCGADASQVRTIVIHALSEELTHSVKSSSQFSQDVRWVDVGTSVGNCDGAGAWLATALALEHARHTGSPQLVLAEQGNELIALMCKTST
ncbi:hypothetical protein [Cupriavidus sp. AcVe19-6a]|uniref:hypothetical protein n=1 Tax=Cupriavidus sp. AcVe19-6a TaxID=2821358 RepID=UPI001AE9DE59|nr:hypothetical protein [Cupriavidus sp. AcVe19-6a]MBP0634213.1 hypothetical protein [Cupriavidus sp. AcVe19-6a]